MNRNWWGRVLALGAGVALLATTAAAEPLASCSRLTEIPWPMASDCIM